ncbi:hypothetical protein LTR60_000778, partial [Cryomyces antarcticus]
MVNLQRLLYYTINFINAMVSQTRQQTLNASLGIVDATSEIPEIDSAFFDASSTRKRARDIDDLPDAEPAKKRSQSAQKTWSYARPAREGELERNKYGQKLWYCQRCRYGTGAPQRARDHMAKRHHVTIMEDESTVSAAHKQKINDLFNKQQACQEGRDIEQERHLRKAVNHPAFNEAISHLVTVRNLLHTIVEWAEFRAVIHSVNYTADEVVATSR